MLFRSSVLDALEARFPVLRGTIRDHVTGQRRPFLRFFGCRQDLSHEHVCVLDIGHERGAPEYVLERADVVVFFGAYGPVPYESLDEVREAFYSHRKFIAAAKQALAQGAFRLRNIEFMPGAYWAVLERADRKSTRLNSSHMSESRMPSSA